MTAFDVGTVDFGRYRRIVQGYFDSEPENDDVSGSAIWCLGSKYSADSSRDGQRTAATRSGSRGREISAADADYPKAKMLGNTQESRARRSSDDVAESQAPNKIDRVWPSEFLDDCESRIWLTYRSNFYPIARSPEASVTFSVRLRNLSEKQGFISDTGWGCMIRSGQCLLANALSVLKLGRSKFGFLVKRNDWLTFPRVEARIEPITGESASFPIC